MEDKCVSVNESEEIIVEIYEETDGHICPCCGEYRFEEMRSYEICPVCGWEDDYLQEEDPDFCGGANKMSLNEARTAYTAGKEKNNENI